MKGIGYQIILVFAVGMIFALSLVKSVTVTVARWNGERTRRGPGVAVNRNIAGTGMRFFSILFDFSPGLPRLLPAGR